MKHTNFDDKNLNLRRVKMKHNGNEKFPPEKRIEVVTKYLALGNRALVAELTGVSYACIRVWQTKDWWRDLEAEIKASRRIQTNSKLSKLVDKALETIEDRLENGDFVYDYKTQELHRKPVSLLQANKVATDLMTRQADLEKTSVAEIQQHQTQSIQDQLKLLAGEFAKFNQARTVDVQALEITDAVHEERETGLQEGGGGVYEPTGSGEEEDGTEQGPLDDEESGEGS